MGRLFLMKKRINENGNVWYSITVPVRDGLKNELFPLRVLRQSAEWIERFSYLFSERRKQKRALRRSFLRYRSFCGSHNVRRLLDMYKA